MNTRARVTIEDRRVRPRVGQVMRLLRGGLFGRARWVSLAVALAVPGNAWAGTGLWQTGGPYGTDGFGGLPIFDPKTPTTLYSGGLKSTDGGDHWFPAATGIQGPITAMVIDPETPTTLYASANTLYKSTDAGDSWVPSLTGPSYADALAIDPRTPSTLYAATQFALLKSIDSAATWAQLDPLFGGAFRVWTLAIDPSATSTVYAGTEMGIFKSTDSGGTWKAVDANNARILVIDPVDPRTIYAAVFGGAVKSTDAGATWTAINNGLTIRDGYAMALDPSTPQTLYVGTIGGGVYKSIDGGASWRAANVGLANLSVGLRQLAVDPSSGSVYVVTADGTFKSINRGETWVPFRPSLAAVVWALALDPENGRTLYAGSSKSISRGGEKGEVYKSLDSGGTWSPVSGGQITGRVFSLAVDPATPRTLYAGTDDVGYGGVYKSIDGGGSWAPLSTGLPNRIVYALAVHPTAPDVVLAGTADGVYRSADRGATWVRTAGNVIMALAIDPQNPNIVYKGSYGHGVGRSPDSGVTWSATGLVTGYVQAMLVDPATPGTLYAGTLNGLLRSADSGATWVPVNAGLTDLDVRALAASPGSLYVGTAGGGVFKSDNQGASWTAFNHGLSSLSALALVIDPAADATTLHLGGYGAWRFRESTGLFHTVTPCRVVDTRANDQPALPPGATRGFTLAGKCGIPVNAGSVSMNVTVTGASSHGHLRIHPGNTARPSNSTLNFAPGDTRANSAVSLLGAAGDLAIFAAQAGGTVDVIIDVNGYFE